MWAWYDGGQQRDWRARSGLACEDSSGPWRRPSDQQSVRQGRNHARVAEADDVGRVVAVDVGEHARIVVLRVPAAGAGAEGGDISGRRLEGALALAKRDLNVRLAEADHV